MVTASPEFLSRWVQPIPKPVPLTPQQRNQQLAAKRTTLSAQPSPLHRPLEEKLFLKVSFDEKDEAKALGARWDAELRLWYVPAGTAADAFSQWFVPQSTPRKRKNPSTTPAPSPCAKTKKMLDLTED